MKNLNRIICFKVVEILITVVFLICSFYLWDSLRNGEVIALLKTTKNNTSYAYVDVLKDRRYQFYPVSDEIALRTLLPSTVQMVNQTKLNTYYEFGLKIRKSSSLNYHNLKISWNDEVHFLSEYYVKEDEEYYYFSFEKGSLKGASKQYEVKVWLDASSNPNQMNRSFDYEFVNLANIL